MRIVSELLMGICRNDLAWELVFVYVVDCYLVIFSWYVGHNEILVEC